MSVLSAPPAIKSLLLGGRFQDNQRRLFGGGTEISDGCLVEHTDDRGPRPGPKSLQAAGGLEFARLVVVCADAPDGRKSPVQNSDDFAGGDQRSRPRQAVAATHADLAF